MGGRGRGRGRGGSSSFSREQLDYMGAGGPGEQLPGPVTQPPPLYPTLENKAVPLVSTKDTNYMLILKQDFLENMQYKSTYVNLPQHQKEPELEIDKLLAQLPKMPESCKFDWKMLPKELRSKISAKRNKQTKTSKEVDIETRLTQLENLERRNVGEKVIKTEATEPEEDEEIVEEEQDEEMDEGTDYVNNYFDNGEEYEDEDDNLDDGPIY